MVTIVVHNGDVESAIKTIVKEQRWYGTYRLLKKKRYHCDARLNSEVRMRDIISRKIKEKAEKTLVQSATDVSATIGPMLLNIDGYNVRIFNDGLVHVYYKDGKRYKPGKIDTIDFSKIAVFLGIPS